MLIKEEVDLQLQDDEVKLGEPEMDTFDSVSV